MKGSDSMNTSSKKKNRKKLNALDYFILLAIVLCLAGAALRMAVGSEGNSLHSQVTMEDYVISYRVNNIRNSSTEYMTEDKEFYLHTTGQYFGKINGSISVTPAMYWIEDQYGALLQAYAPENGDATRVDVTGTMLVSGYMGENGFLLGGTTSLAVNKDLALRSRDLYITITITDIAKAS